MTVWIVTETTFDAMEILGVYSDLEKAEKAIEELWPWAQAVEWGVQ